MSTGDVDARRATGPVPPEHFRELYAASDDPWGFASRWYERRKYALTLASLPRPVVGRGLEVGCSIGVLTAALAERCEALLALDVEPRALELARARVPPSVELRRCRVPHEWPEGTFDLVVLCEVAYYLDGDDLDLLLRRATAAVAPGGALVAVHWRHPVAEYPTSGDDVHAALAAVVRRAGGLVRTVSHVEDDVLLDVHERPGPDEDPAWLSVAARDGLVRRDRP